MKNQMKPIKVYWPMRTAMAGKSDIILTTQERVEVVAYADHLAALAEAVRNARERCAKVCADLMLSERDKSPDDRIGDGSIVTAQRQAAFLDKWVPQQECEAWNDEVKADLAALLQQAVAEEAGQRHAADAVKCATLEAACEAGLEAMRHIIYSRRDDPDDQTLTPENVFVKLDDHMNQLERTFIQKAQAALHAGEVDPPG